MEVKVQGKGNKIFSGKDLIGLVNNLVRYKECFGQVAKNKIPKKILGGLVKLKVNSKCFESVEN